MPANASRRRPWRRTLLPDQLLFLLPRPPANPSATDSAMLQSCLARMARLEAALAGLDGVVAPVPAAVAQLQRTMPAIWAMRADLDRVESWLSGVPMPQAPHAVPS